MSHGLNLKHLKDAKGTYLISKGEQVLFSPFTWKTEGRLPIMAGASIKTSFSMADVPLLE